MKQVLKNLIYLVTFFPIMALAQVRSKSDGFGRPDIWQMFSSISVFLYVILGGIGALSIIGFFLAAIDYAAASGDEERVSRSGKTFAFSLIGIIISAVGIIILSWAGGTIRK